MTTIAPLPPAPQPSDDEATFNAKAFAFNDALDDFGAQANAVASETNAAAAAAAGSQGASAASEANALDYKNAAAASASASANSAGASPWVSGSYATGVAARSTVDYRIYVARTTGSKPSDPSTDPTNWALASGNGLQLIPVTGTTGTGFIGARSVLKNAAATTLTAPTTSTAGDEFAVKWVNNRFDNTINFGGAKVEGVAVTTLTLNDSPRGAKHWVWIDSTTGWGAIV